jgi:2,5-diketo-D-gluconate reductase A
MNDDAPAAVAAAIQAGYRLIDTAQAYGNEKGVGEGVRRSGVPREEIFITTKFNAEFHSRSGVQQAWHNSTKLLGVDYIDMMLIHWPNPGLGKYMEAWEGLVDLLKAGKVRAIGTSNFKPSHLLRLEFTGVTPDVNQIQLSPYYQRRESVAFHQAHGIVTESWSPLKPAELLSDHPVQQAAANHGVSPAQVVLRWQLQSGFVPIPKSSNLQRQKENLAVFDFTLTEPEMADLNTLDLGEDDITDSDVFGH